MRKTRRTAKVGESIRDALVDVFRRDLKDVSLGFVSISDVEVSPDLHLARVFLTGLKEDETKTAAKELNARKGRIRSELGKRVRLRYTPELEFKYDETAMRAGRIDSILLDIRKEDDLRPRDEEPEAAEPETAETEPGETDAADGDEPT
jgi:ribosome-binding factor A